MEGFMVPFITRRRSDPFGVYAGIGYAAPLTTMHILPGTFGLGLALLACGFAELTPQASDSLRYEFREPRLARYIVQAEPATNRLLKTKSSGTAWVRATPDNGSTN